MRRTRARPGLERLAVRSFASCLALVVAACRSTASAHSAVLDCSAEPATLDQVRQRTFEAVAELDSSVETIVVKLPRHVTDCPGPFDPLDHELHHLLHRAMAAGLRAGLGERTHPWSGFDDFWIPGDPFAVRLHRIEFEPAIDLVHSFAPPGVPYDYLKKLIEHDLRDAGVPFSWGMSMTESVHVPRTRFARARAVLARRPELAQIMRRLDELYRPMEERDPAPTDPMR